MTISEKIKTKDNEIEQNKAQYSLNRQIVKTLALSLGNVGKCKFLTSKNVLTKKTCERKLLQSKGLNIH